MDRCHLWFNYDEYSICSSLIRQIHLGNTNDWRSLTQLVVGEPGDDFLCVQQRKEPYEARFIQDKVADVKQIQKRTWKFWYVFAGNLNTKQQILQSLFLKCDIQMEMPKQYKQCLIDGNYFPLHCLCDMVVDYVCGIVVYPPFTVADLKKSEMSCLLLSDQYGGIVTCGVCKHSVYNCILPLGHFKMIWWMDHINSSLHKKNVP